MKSKQKPQMKQGPMLLITGPDKLALIAAKDCLVEIIKTAGTEGSVIASVNAFVALCKAPGQVSISNCHFDNSELAKGEGK